MAENIDAHAARLKALSEGLGKKLTQALYMGGRKIELEAEHSITQGSVSGKFHVPSLPGQPPNRDTGVLDSNIETRIVASGDRPEVHVESKAPYAVPLEFGTKKMAARPYMRPAAQKKSREVARLVGAVVQAELRRQSDG